MDGKSVIKTGTVPSGLKVNLLDRPYGLANGVPAFSWMINSNSADIEQKAYRIVIGKRLADLWRGCYLFDTGRIISGNHTYVKPEGISEILKDNELYYWQVQVWDGTESPLSAPQAFTTGIGGEWADRNGIWSGDGTGNANFVFLRTAFSLESMEFAEKAILSVTASSPEKIRQYVYRIYMNGAFLGAGPARLGKTGDDQEILYYNSYDVTNYLREGENVISAENYTVSDKSFLCQLTLFYRNGRKEILLNSGRDVGQWKAFDATELFGEGLSIGTVYYTAAAENINACLYPVGWKEPGYDDSDWHTAVLRGPMRESALLEPYPAGNVSLFPQPAVLVEKREEGHYFIDFGKEFVGGLRLCVNSPKVARLTINCGEELNEDGSVRYAMRSTNVYQEFWTLRKGPQEISNIGMKTFRYAEIFNCPVELTPDMISGIALRQEFDESASFFQSSNELLNQIYALTKYTIKATNQDLYVDSQSRERLAYEGDALINMLSSYSFESSYALARFSGEYLNTHRTWPVEYALYSVIIAYLDYLYTGNTASIEANYDILKTKFYTEQLDSEKGLLHVCHSYVNRWDSVLVDWPQSEHDGYCFGEAYYNTVMNAVSCGAYFAMAEIARALGKEEDERQYVSLYGTLKRSMIAYLYDRECGAFCDGLKENGEKIAHYAQHATAFALAFGIYDSPEMAARLADKIRRDGKIKTSVYGAFFVLEGLYNADAGDIAADLLTDPDDSFGARTWAYMLSGAGATITTEAWNTRNKGNMTFSHPWGSAPASQITRGLFGIRPLEAGFDRFQIRFRPGHISRAFVKMPCVKGQIEAGYEMSSAVGRDGEHYTFTARICVPADSRAVVFLPAASGSCCPEEREIHVSVNGNYMEAQRAGMYAGVEVGSGRYEFSISW